MNGIQARLQHTLYQGSAKTALSGEIFLQVRLNHHPPLSSARLLIPIFRESSVSSAPTLVPAGELLILRSPSCHSSHPSKFGTFYFRSLPNTLPSATTLVLPTDQVLHVLHWLIVAFRCPDLLSCLLPSSLFHNGSNSNAKRPSYSSSHGPNGQAGQWYQQAQLRSCSSQTTHWLIPPNRLRQR